jgi:hypothetical protein
MNLVHKECRNRTDRVKTKRRQLSKVAAALTALVALAVLGRPTAVFAQETPYTVASLEGDYGFVGAYSGDVARLVGTAYFDGKGNLTTGSARVVIVGGHVKPITYSGVYTMNPDGTGKITATVFGVATPPPIVNFDFVITKARFIHGIKIATEVQDAQEEPSVVVSTGSVFVTHVYTRRPDHEEHR